MGVRMCYFFVQKCCASQNFYYLCTDIAVARTIRLVSNKG